MKTCIRLLSSLALLVYLSVPAYGQQTLLWRVSGNGLKKPSYHFGTHHLVPGDFLAALPEAEKRLRKSKNVVVEVVLDSTQLSQLSGLMVEPSGPGWTENLTPSTRQLLDSVLQRHLGASLAQMGVLRPAALSSILALTLTKLHSDDTLQKFSGLPLDVSIAAKAKKRKQNLLQLESMQEQFNILYVNPPLDSQVAELNRMVAQLDSIGPYSRQLVVAYLQQNVTGMQALLNDYTASYGGMEKLLDERNNRWMQQLPAIFKSGPTFVAVGALHLYGPAGLITQLQQAGYKVEPLKNASDDTTLFESGMDIVMWIALLVIFTSADGGTKPKTSSNNPQHG